MLSSMVLGSHRSSVGLVSNPREYRADVSEFTTRISTNLPREREPGGQGMTGAGVLEETETTDRRRWRWKLRRFQNRAALCRSRRRGRPAAPVSWAGRPARSPSPTNE